MARNFSIVKKLDEAGRLVIPIDIRKTYGFEKNKMVVLVLKEDGVFCKPMEENKQNPD